MTPEQLEQVLESAPPELWLVQPRKERLYPLTEREFFTSEDAAIDAAKVRAQSDGNHYYIYKLTFQETVMLKPIRLWNPSDASAKKETP